MMTATTRSDRNRPIDTTSYWSDSVRFPRFRKLDQELSVDVVVVGAGITGITAAYLLKRSGFTVALVERDRVGGVDSAHTTAHLTFVTDQRLHWLVDNFGKARAKAVWDAGLAAIDRISAIVREEGIECEFTWVPGYLHVPADGDSRRERRRLQREARLARELGFEADYLEAVPYFGVPGVGFAHQAKFHPLAYLSALIRTIPGDGCHVFDHTAVEEVQDSPLAVKAGSHRIRCRYVVLATHTPLMGKTNVVKATLLQTKLYPYSTYAVGARIRRGLLPEASFWDTADPYHYLRIDRRRGFDYAILGGLDHKTGQKRSPSALYRRLETTLRRMIPGAVVDHRWSGQVIETNDGLPFIGETSDRQFSATGFAGNGMTFGTLGATMAVDALLGRKNPWQRLFAVDRKKLRGGLLTYLDENKDYPFYLVRDRLARPKTRSVRSVRRNEGRIVNLNGKKVVAYRDGQGRLTLRSPVCTHMGCIVAWNDAERTWDCPCHGSRFGPTGQVIAGPAERDLAELTDR